MFYEQGKVTLICIEQSELWIKCLRSSSVCKLVCFACLATCCWAVRVPYPWYCICLFLWIFSDKVQNRISCAVVMLAVLHMKSLSDWWMMNVIQTLVARCRSIVKPVGCSHLEKKIGENMKQQSTVSRQSSLLLYFVVEIFHVRWGRVAECII